MITRGQARSFSAFRLLLLAALMPSGLACVGVGQGDGSIHGGEDRMVEAQIRLPDAEQMIDDLDRMLTANGTIGVKSPDVWGQDRLAKFRSEYETQLSEWLKTGYKGDINASIRRSETEAHGLYVGTTPNNSSAHETTAGNQTSAANSSSKSTASPSASTPAPDSSPDRTTVALEPTVVLDEHSNYLNHLNQLRRINAGDDLTDRPGYGLYLVRIPVTLSPGPRSRRGKGAIITVSAKSLMTRDTLRNTLRNTVINETVNNLTQAIVNPPTKDGEPTSGPRRRLVLTRLVCRHRGFLRAAEHRPAQERGRSPARPGPGRRASPPQRTGRRLVARRAGGLVPVAGRGRHAGSRGPARRHVRSARGGR